jgi:hypothetical protein
MIWTGSVFSEVQRQLIRRAFQAFAASSIQPVHQLLDRLLERLFLLLQLLLRVLHAAARGQQFFIELETTMGSCSKLLLAGLQVVGNGQHFGHGECCSESAKTRKRVLCLMDEEYSTKLSIRACKKATYASEYRRPSGSSRDQATRE